MAAAPPRARRPCARRRCEGLAGLVGEDLQADAARVVAFLDPSLADDVQLRDAVAAAAEEILELEGNARRG
ncbi:hypothetical protein [Tessaracoccus sp. MC1679]|uniref:hypothetical protein n=1 Tax=Tessaracoccus sp. MC1679 TaxID=2760313 RepID=UPI001C720ED1|nr:hypothetical protein [Tessaracoccus sp. MC1679]